MLQDKTPDNRPCSGFSGQGPLCWLGSGWYRDSRWFSYAVGWLIHHSFLLFFWLCQEHSLNCCWNSSIGSMWFWSRECFGISLFCFDYSVLLWLLLLLFLLYANCLGLLPKTIDSLFCSFLFTYFFFSCLLCFALFSPPLFLWHVNEWTLDHWNTAPKRW